jgi:phosphopantothenate-cysteine ligase
MRVIITSGGTTENIDEVRGITNHSTGHTGARLAEKFLNAGAVVELVTTREAIKPQMDNENLHVHIVRSTMDVLTAVTELLKTPADAVLHAMAISDYTPSFSLPGETFYQELASRLQKETEISAKTIKSVMMQIQNGTDKKISSSDDRLFISLEKTPKIVQQIKTMQPDVILIQFKLLVDVDKEELVNVAFAALQKSNGDYVVANDLNHVHAEEHLAYLVSKNKNVETMHTNEEIANKLLKLVEQKAEADQ